MTDVTRQPYVFISYASVDRERVLLVVERLEAAGVRVWIDREGIHGGANYAQVINDAIQGSTALLLFASPAALASRNVKQELALGWRYERPYLPLLLDVVTIPGELAYWLEGSQWIELLDRPESAWLADVAKALQPHGMHLKLPQAPTAGSGVGRARPLLVGREREQAVLRQNLEQMLAGRGSVLLVGGEAGIGKTTLVEDLSIQAEEAGALVLWGHAYDLSVTPPYGPWLEIFRTYRSVSAGLPPLPPFIFDADELAKVGSQDALFVQVAEFLQSVAAQRPLLLVLDDFHWFDQASLDFHRFLSRQVGSQQILLVATYRSDELHRRHPLYALLPLLVRESSAERMEVRRLDEVGNRALIQSRYALADAEQERLKRYLEDHAEGNPLYAGELLRTLEESGALVMAEAGWQLGDLEQVRVPPMLRQVIEGRLARLPETTRELLDVAAIIGQDMPFDLWMAVAGADESAILEAVESAVHAAVLVVLNDGSGAQFRHALLREALYENVLPLRRRLWHRKTAEVLATTRTPDPDQVAYHYQQAGDERAVEWLITAGERARRSYVWATAVTRWDAALAKLTEQQAPVRDQFSLLFRIAMVQRYADPHRAAALLGEVAKLATEVGEAGVATISTFLEGLSRYNTGEVDTGLSQMMRAAEAFEEFPPGEHIGIWGRIHSGTPFYEGSLIGCVVSQLAELGRLSEASSWAERFRAMPIPELTPGQPGSPYGDGLSGWAVLAALLGRSNESRLLSQKARDVYGVIEHHWRLAQVLGDEIEFIHLPYFPEELDERRRLSSEALLAVRKAQGTGGIHHSQQVLLPLLWIEGTWGTAWEVVLACDDLQHCFQRQCVQRYLGLLGYAQGDVAIAHRAIAPILANGPATEPGEVSIFNGLGLQRLAVTLALDAHDLSAARAWLEAHDRWLNWSGVVLGRAEGALLWGRYHHANGDRNLARQQADQALSQASDPRQPLALIAIHRFLGRLDTEAGALDAADAHFNDSLRLADACAAPFERALTLLGLAELRMAQNKPDEARAMIDEVQTICEPLGATPTLARAATLRLGPVP